METRAPRLGAILAICVFALSCFGGALFVWDRFGGSLPLQPEGFRFSVSFHEGGNLAPNADVRISGVEVGKVVAVRPRGQRTEAEIELEPRYAPLRSDARAILRVKTLLGEPFIALTPGSRGAPLLPEGGRLADARVDRNQQLDEVLQSFDAPARRALKELTLELAQGLHGRDAQLGRALGGSADLSDRLDQLAVELDRDRPALTRLVREAGTTLNALGDRSASLRRLVRRGAEVVRTTAAEDDGLRGLVRATPAFLARLQRLSGTASRTFDAAQPTVRALLPAAKRLPAALDRADALLPPATTLFDGLPATLRSARRNLPRLPAVASGVAALADPLNDLGAQLVPVAQVLNAYRKDLVTAMATTAALAQASVPQPDGSLAHYMRVLINLSNESVVGSSPQRLPTNRHNPYPPPDSYGDLGKPGGLRSFSCTQAKNPAGLPAVGLGTPPCLTQEPWTFRGKTRQYPDLSPAG